MTASLVKPNNIRKMTPSTRADRFSPILQNTRTFIPWKRKLCSRVTTSCKSRYIILLLWIVDRTIQDGSGHALGMQVKKVLYIQATTHMQQEWGCWCRHHIRSKSDGSIRMLIAPGKDQTTRATLPPPKTFSHMYSKIHSSENVNIGQWFSLTLVWCALQAVA